MALVKISDLALFTGTPAVGDMYEYVDISEALDADKSKRILGNKIALFLPAQLANNIVETAAIKDGEVTLAKLNADAIPDAVLVTRSADQSIPNDTETELLWDTEVHDYGGLHSIATNTGRLVAQKDGVYGWTLNGRFYTEGTGYRQVAVFKNGSGGTRLTWRVNDAGAYGEQFSFSGEVDLDAAEYINAYVRHTKGSPATWERDNDHYPSFSMHYIRAN